ncbi:hypothetical protein GCM10009850_120880 [Nonomuraea monospora]|uniref:Beta-lactamase-related domain-containing protein n=1 Tax=Nonomuraea monospora TaxID=568818 RepID=A0ABP5Q272_9ACTN
MFSRQLTAARVVSAACAALALSVSTPATAATLAPVMVGDVQAAMEALVKSGKVVGAIGEVYVDGKRVAKGSAGSRLLDGKGGKIPSTDRYRIASQTKQMTATVIMQFVQAGKLKLDDKLGKLLPEVAKKGLVKGADEVTVQNLVQHTSGILDAENPDVDVFDTTVTHRPMDLPAVTGTGTIGTVAYANTNHILLA